MSISERATWLQTHETPKEMHLDSVVGSTIMFKEIGETCKLVEKLKPEILAQWQTSPTPILCSDVKQAFESAEDGDQDVFSGGNQTLSLDDDTTGGTSGTAPQSSGGAAQSKTSTVKKKKRGKTLVLMCNFWRINENPTVVREWSGLYCNLAPASKSLDFIQTNASKPGIIGSVLNVIKNAVGISNTSNTTTKTLVSGCTHDYSTFARTPPNIKIQCKTMAPSIFIISNHNTRDSDGIAETYAIHDPSFDPAQKDVRKHTNMLQECIMDAVGVCYDDPMNETQKKEFLATYHHIDYLCSNSSTNLTAGFHKSMLHKITRMQSKTMDLPGTLQNPNQRIIVDVEWVFCIIMVFLLKHAGAFVPDIQRFVTGMESVCKRTVVAAVEESYFENVKDFTFLNNCAILSQRHAGTWFPTSGYVTAWLGMGLQVLNEQRCFIYDVDKEHKHYSISENTSLWGNLSASLDLVKSFRTDESMLRDVAYRNERGKTLFKNGKNADNDNEKNDNVKNDTKEDVKTSTTISNTPAVTTSTVPTSASASTSSSTIPKGQVKKYQRPEVMKWEDAIDFHWDTRFTFYLTPSQSLAQYPPKIASLPFQPLFKAMFKHVTGQNPRRVDKFTLLDPNPSKKRKEFIDDIRRAQQLFWKVMCQ